MIWYSKHSCLLRFCARSLDRRQLPSNRKYSTNWISILLKAQQDPLTLQISHPEFSIIPVSEYLHLKNPNCDSLTLHSKFLNPTSFQVFYTNFIGTRNYHVIHIQDHENTIPKTIKVCPMVTIISLETKALNEGIKSPTPTLWRLCPTVSRF